MDFLLASPHVIVGKSIFSIRGDAVLEAAVMGEHAQSQHLRDGLLINIAFQASPYVLPARESVVDFALMRDRIDIVRRSWFYAARRRKNVSLEFL